MIRLRPLFLLLLALSACAPAPPNQFTPAAAVPTVAASPTVAPSATAPAATGTVAPSATPDPPTPTPRFAPPSPTPALPAQTIGADTVSSLHPLRAVGVGRAVQATLSHDDTLAAVATTAGVALLELPSMRLAQFFALPGGVDAVTLSPDGTRVALKRVYPETVELRRVSDGAVLASAPGGSMTFSPDGALFAGGADTRTDPPDQLILLRSADGTKVATIPGADAAFSPDGKTIATTVVGDGNVGTWLRRADGSEIGFIQGGDARFGPDSQLVATTVFPLDGSTPQTGIYRSASAEPAFAADGSLPTFSADGRTLAVAKARAVVLYSVPDGKQLALLQPDSAAPNAYGNSDALAIAFSADGHTLRAVVGGDLYAWSVADGKRLNTFTGLAQRGGQPDAAFAPGGAALISRNVIGDADCGLYSGLRVLAVDGRELAADTQGVDAQFSTDGKLAAIVSSLGTVRVVPLGDTESDMVASLPGYGAIAFSPEGATLAASQARNGNNPFGPSAVELYDVADGALKTSLAVDSYVGEPTSLRFGDATTLFAEEESGCDFVYEVKQTAWDVRAGGAGRTIWQAPVVSSEPQPQAASIRAFSPLTGIGAWVNANDEVGIAQRGVTTTLNLEAPATALALSPDGATLAVGDAQGAVQLLDPKSGAALQPRSALSAHAETGVTQLAFSPDGTLIVARRGDGQVLVWRSLAAKPIVMLIAEADDAQLLVSPDNQLLVSAGPKGVSFYSLGDGRKIQTLDVAASKVAMGPGRRLLAVLSDERVTLWGVQ